MKRCNNFIKFSCFLDISQEFDNAKSAIIVKINKIYVSSKLN
ncbi:MAG: hypothetical protein QG564_1043 [Campylobacterota bacterium]|nr:hypothetical protein [Campylobacterota bacterium]